MRTITSRWTQLFLLLLLLAACRPQSIPASDIRLDFTVSDMLVGETTLLVKVTDADGNVIVNPGTLTIRGDMDHAGMTPVFAEAQSAVNGVFSLPFEWTMGGGWIVEASLELENGDVANQTFHYEILTEADDRMTGMDHDKPDADAGQMDEMDHAEMQGESSAVYLRIRNSGESDIEIVSAESAASAHIDFHQTVVDDDMVHMETIDSLVIPAGETIELLPGGAHIMLSSLAADLVPDGNFTLELTCSGGEKYQLVVPVRNMLMADAEDEIAIGDLVFSNPWARSARAAAPSG